MGLITKEVEIKWTKRNKKYYISKDYLFTKLGDVFIVNVKNLSFGSHIFVKIKYDCDCNCENHDKIKPITWQNYLKQVRENDKIYCQKCSMKMYGTENYRKSVLKNGKSFEQWCVENNQLDVLNRWDYKLNNCKPNEISYSTNIKYYFKCPKGIHKSELKNINGFVINQKGEMNCKVCNSFAQWGIDNLGEDFLEKHWDYDKNNELGIDPWEISYGSHINEIWIKCQNKQWHTSYLVTCNRFVSSGTRCPYCCNQKIHPLNSLGKLLEDKDILFLWSEKNECSPYQFSPKGDTIRFWWKCPDGIHEDYPREANVSNMCDFRCPECSRKRDESILQEKIRLYLETFDYTILHENDCTIIAQNPKTKNKRGKMPYDNEIQELQLIIETHGKQHYEKSLFHILQAKRNNTTPEYELHRQKLHDRYKHIFAKSRGYFYLEIPYWTDDEDETWKKLIDEKIQDILTTDKYKEVI